MSNSDVEDPQVLFRLIAQYGEDFPDFFGSVREAYQNYESHSSEEQLAGALSALDGLLATARTEEDLERRLHRLGFNYGPKFDGSATYRDFLLRLRGWLVESLEQRPPVPEPEP